METLGFKRSIEDIEKIDYIIRNRESFFEIKKVTRDLWAIFNRVTGKRISEKEYPRGKALDLLGRI